MAKEKIRRKEKITKEVELPDGVSASMHEQFLTVKGPNGEVKREIKNQNISINIEPKKIIFEAGKATKENKKIIGSLVAHAKNMVRGSLNNHIYTLKICSGHFPMSVSVNDSKLYVKNFLG